MVAQTLKDVLLLPVTDGGITQYFNMPGFPNYNKAKTQHNGLDIGWVTVQYCNILACQDGTVVEILTNNSTCGNGVVLQHDYPDGTHRWTAYIHMKSVKVKKGATVKQGDILGVRGGTPMVDGKQKYGTHLHLYVTSANKLSYTWNTMKKNVVDPLPLLYRSEKVSYNWINADLRALPLMNNIDELAQLKQKVTTLQKQIDEIRAIVG